MSYFDEIHIWPDARETFDPSDYHDLDEGWHRVPNTEHVPPPPQASDPTQHATFRRVPTSCHCGGDMAWVAEIDGAMLMLGCCCHTDLLSYLRDRIIAGPVDTTPWRLP